MKWRHSLIYLLILGLLGGYYYYFEVVKKREKDEAARAKNRLFSIEAQAVEEVILEAQGKPAVHLVKKDGSWRVAQPVQAEADQGAVDTLVHALVETEKSRDVDSAPKDMTQYGLTEPTLGVRFRSGDAWQRLRVGSKNPTGESHYAARGDESAVFLVAVGQVQAVSKGPDELRRRDLLTFEEEEIQKVSLSWAQGERLELERDASDKDTWRCPQEPERRVKSSKVQNMLNQIRWLRAKSFLGDMVGESASVWPSGGPEVTVILSGADGSESSLQIGPKAEEKETYVALSSQMSTLVTIDGSVLKELPKTVRDVEDRSVASLDSKNISRVEYTLRGESGELILQEDGSWAHVTKKEGESRRVLKESWRVRPVFWEWEDLEYEAKAATDTCPQAQEAQRMALYGKDSRSVVFSWPGESGREDQTLTLCTGSGEAFFVKSDKIRDIERKFQDVLQSPSK